MTIKILLDPQPYHLGAGGDVVMYAADVPRVGDYIRVDNQLDTTNGKPVEGKVTFVMHHVGPEPDDAYVVVTFEPDPE